MIMYLNTLNIIKLSYIQKKYILILPIKKKNIYLLNFLLSIHYIKNYFIVDNSITVLLYKDNNKKIKNLYTPSNPKYISYNQLKYQYKNNININLILLTNKGLMTQLTALNNNIGGFLFFIII